MEVVGGVASVVQLVQCASALAKTTGKLCQRLKHAPEKITTARSQLILIHSEIDRVQAAANVCHALLLSRDTWQEFDGALNEARVCANDLSALIWKDHDVESLGSRARWAFKDHKTVDKIATRLHGVDSRLSSLMGTLTL
jgi:hypothetical protein